jgi:hypothetical protein
MDNWTIIRESSGIEVTLTLILNLFLGYVLAFTPPKHFKLALKTGVIVENLQRRCFIHVTNNIDLEFWVKQQIYQYIGVTNTAVQ